MPGYVLTRHVPPTSSAASSSRKSSTPCLRSRMAVAMPPNPAPTMTTSASTAAKGDRPLAERQVLAAELDPQQVLELRDGLVGADVVDRRHPHRARRLEVALEIVDE